MLPFRPRKSVEVHAACRLVERRRIKIDRESESFVSRVRTEGRLRGGGR